MRLEDECQVGPGRGRNDAIQDRPAFGIGRVVFHEIEAFQIDEGSPIMRGAGRIKDPHNREALFVKQAPDLANHQYVLALVVPSVAATLYRL